MSYVISFWVASFRAISQTKSDLSWYETVAVAFRHVISGHELIKLVWDRIGSCKCHDMYEAGISKLAPITTRIQHFSRYTAIDYTILPELLCKPTIQLVMGTRDEIWSWDSVCIPSINQNFGNFGKKI